MRSTPRGPRSASLYGTSLTEVTMWKRVRSHLRRSTESRFEDWPKKKLPSQETLIKGRDCWNFAWLEENVLIPVSCEGKTEEHSVCVGESIEIDLPRKAYCSLCTDTVSYGIDTASYGTDTVSYRSFSKKGLPGLHSVLPPASNIDVLWCTATRAVISASPRTLYNQ